MTMRESSYVGLLFKEKTISFTCRRLYEKIYPGKTFGHTDKYKGLFESSGYLVIIDRDDLDCLQKELLLKENMPDSSYELEPVFTADEVSNTEKIDLLQNKIRVIERCEICDTWMLSGRHKHFLKFCPVCNRRTEWATPFFGFPFSCVDPAHDYSKEKERGLKLPIKSSGLKLKEDRVVGLKIKDTNNSKK